MKPNEQIPVIQVGIMSEKELGFTFNGSFSCSAKSDVIDGDWKAIYSDGTIILSSEKNLPLSGKEILFTPLSPEASFTLHSVTIGVNFHWQREEDQTFRGKLKLVIEKGRITAINILPLEDYLISVISSEMSATSSAELLKAHAVISRSWLLAQIEKNKTLGRSPKKYQSFYRTDTEITRWYDREDHEKFDVCADDHCQRYQGITRASTPLVEHVVRETSGEVLTYNNLICDARFSKCCGGVTEVFENTWEPVNHPYLQKLVDNPVAPEGFSLNLEENESAEKWINGKPDAFCNTTDAAVLRQVLNDYDQETHDFYRWSVTYDQDDLSRLVFDRTGIDFGQVTDIIPLTRGTSGRITRLQIKGTKTGMILGKELEIRKALSKSHLYSSAFLVEKKEAGGKVTFTLKGAGWGHGVGLCQIGAAVMGSKGYSYKEILEHYFRGASLSKRY
ncbi:MAG TPA: SpoIID/LytB domain-containing protein [Bacteroidales bacterium]|nr:SpoIID/LytB domain-containing protein [Bacteroidales bacterium]HPT12485.1 SpoIID/LytB domain-containing protein [Bacteroidales bacterium]